MGVSRARLPGVPPRGLRRADLAGCLKRNIPRRRSRRPAPRSFHFVWAKAVSSGEWKLYSKAIAAVRKTGVPFLLGGGFALASYTGRWRDTKDIDFYIRPSDRDQVIAALSRAGFGDYYEQRAYDRRWIYRSTKAGVIVDVIWSMANQRAEVDDVWFDRAGVLELRGQRLLVVPPEELLWCKLYILQRDHCDWTDALNLLYATGPELDWQHVLDRLDEDAPLLKAVLQIYGWLCPSQAARLPDALWRSLRMTRPGPRRKPKRDHVRLLDSRGWFAALQPPDRKLEV